MKQINCAKIRNRIRNAIHMFIADLRPGGESNWIAKYADDACLLVPENTDVQINELDRVAVWASENKLGINMAKNKEVVSHRPHPKKSTPANNIAGNWKGLDHNIFTNLIAV